MKTVYHQKCTLFVVITLLLIFFGFALRQPVLAGSNTLDVTGEIISIAYGPWNPFGRSATIRIKDSKKKEYTVYVGFKTTYVPRRTPVVGDRVTVNCIKDNRGVWAVTTVTYK